MPAFLQTVRRSAGAFRPVTVAGLPRVPRGVALLALRLPWLVPVRLRWRAAAGGLGLVIARLQAESSVGAVMQSLGEEHGRSLREQLSYGKGPLECARAVTLANRLFRIHAHSEMRGESALVITPGCPWSREEWWGATACGAFSRYEVGLTRGLNPQVRLRYESKRTRGDRRCVGVYSWSEERKAE